MPDLSEFVKPSKSAVIVVDVQNDFCEPAGVAGKNGKDTSAAQAMIPALSRFLTAAREHGTNVIFIQTIHEPCTDSDAWIGRRANPAAANCLKGSWARSSPASAGGERSRCEQASLQRLSQYATRFGAADLKVENILVLGVATNVCVESTSRHATCSTIIRCSCPIARLHTIRLRTT